MEQPPRIRDQIKDLAVEARTKASIGHQVVNDCRVFGISIWRRNEDGSIESLDPTLVQITVMEPSEIPMTASQYLATMTEPLVLSEEDEQKVADLLHRELNPDEGWQRP